MNQNPLKNYFRTPGIHIHLPTRGRYNKDDIDFSMSGEIEIFPLTATDEMYINTPDSLLNGSAVEHVIKSCAPAIKCDPKFIPMADVDAIMLASKLVTYGDEFNIGTKCPSCGNEEEAILSIRHLLASAKEFPKENIIKLGELVIHLRPYDLESSTKIQLVELNEANLLNNLINDSTKLEDRLNLVQPSVNRIVHSMIDIICYGIEKIDFNDQEIINRSYIKEFITNVPASITKAIKNKQEHFNEYGIEKEHEMTCSKCKHKWNVSISYDPSSFFAASS